MIIPKGFQDLYWLQEKWPALFDLAYPKPLKRQVDRDILPHIPESFTQAQFKAGTQAYVNRAAYLEAILTGS